MSRDNALTKALNEVEIALGEAADWYSAAAHMVEDPALAELFNGEHQRKQSHAEALERQIRQFGLPKFPDPEKETFDQVLSRLKRWLAEDPQAALVQDGLRKENRLKTAVEEAAVREVPPAIRSLLDQIRSEASDAQQVLQAKTPGPSDPGSSVASEE